jgi:hypothetical protein
VVVEKWIAWPDQHWPHHDVDAFEVAQLALAKLKPFGLLSLGDGLDCLSFSSHPPKTFAEKNSNTQWTDDLAGYGKQLKRARKSCKKFVWVEGNHCDRIKRKALDTPALASCLDLILPQRVLKEYISTFVPYDVPGSHYKLTPSLWAVHGWSCGQNANRDHLNAATNFSIMHGHTHQCGHVSRRDPPTGKVLQAWSFGCLYTPQPGYMGSKPTKWTHGFGVVYIDRAKKRHDIFSCKIENGCTVLPDGREVKL